MLLSLSRAQVRSPVRELRSHKPHSVAKKKTRNKVKNKNNIFLLIIKKILEAIL